jgi:hypothetical protein
MSSLDLRRLFVTVGALALCGLISSCTVPEVESDPTVDPKTGSAPADPQSGVAGPILNQSQESTLIENRTAKVKTGLDTYIVHDIRFETAEGFGSDRAIMGYYNNTLWQFEIRFIRSIEVIGKIDESEALSAPDNYFAREDSHLRRTFRTWLTKTDGESVEFIVRIDAIYGSLERGGNLQLSIEELEGLRRIDFL